MEISQYTGTNLLAPRDVQREQSKTAITPISAVSGNPSQTPQDEESINLFDTLLDTVNPLQHIPGVSTAYRAVTGDESNALANMAGGFLFGGPVGLAAGAATSFLEMLTGKDLMGHAMAFFDGDDVAPEPAPDAGLELTKSTEAQSNESLFKSTKPMDVSQYLAYAQAQAEQNKGFGADANDVSWSSNIWTQNALKEATGLYESSQDRADKPRQQSQQRSV
ncbi:MAG: hypothetical protein JKY27_05440 [Magnetovibrio sp.]|nr:hypothetical protein [Magnetovibrio sp.]